MTVHAYHDPAVLQRALTLARKLWSAADGIEGSDAGREAAGTRASREWIGPRAERFTELHDTERTSAETSRHQLRAEAQAWSRYWLECTNVRTERHHRERMDAYERAYRQPDGTWADHAPDPPTMGTIYTSPPPPPSFVAHGAGLP